MLDIGWSELLVIAIVMIVVVGPKDLPKMLRAFGKATARMRATANEFRNQFNEALKEAELDDVKNIIDETRKLDPRSKLTQVFDPIRTAGEDIRAGLQSGTSMSPATPEKPAEVTTPVEADGTPVPPPAPVAPAPAAAEPAKAEAKPRKTAARPKKVAAVPKTAARAAAAKPAAAPKTAAKKPAAPKAAAKKPAAAKAAAPARKTTRKTGNEA